MDIQTIENLDAGSSLKRRKQRGGKVVRKIKKVIKHAIAKHKVKKAERKRKKNAPGCGGSRRYTTACKEALQRGGKRGGQDPNYDLTGDCGNTSFFKKGRRNRKNKKECKERTRSGIGGKIAGLGVVGAADAAWKKMQQE